jgi:transposase InsO family protein
MGGEDLPVPWGTSVVEDRVRFVLSVERGEASVSALCETYGISRQTGHKWLRRWRDVGVAGLVDGSRAPLRRPGSTVLEVVEALVAKRRERPSWGPRKLLAVLREERPEVIWPAASTAGALLKRAGLVQAQRRVRRAVPRERPFAAAVAPNDEWAIDFKGWFRTGDGKRCDPLTVSDTASRMLLECRIMQPRTAEVAVACEALFRTVGLPRRLRMDNGTPFASRGAAGLTRLSVGWAKLGIELARIDPGEPSQNGRHERMHGTLQRETAMTPATSLAAQQARFDAFRRDYNEERPHEGLGQVPPARLWQPSARAYPERIEEPWYPADHQVRRVRTNGTIKWRGGWLFISEALTGEPIGLVELPSGGWLARFLDIDLGVVDRRGESFLPFAAARPGRREGQEQNKETVTHVSGPPCQ